LSLRQRLEQIDALLWAGGAEEDFVRHALEGWNPEGKESVTAGEQMRFQQRSRRALRCTILRTLLKEDYRGFSCQLAGNPLFQWFCGVDALDEARVPSKSELHRFAHWLPAEAMREVLDGLLRQAIQQPQKLELTQTLDLEEYFLDSTCLKANVHFPSDWVLLRDGVRTLMKVNKGRVPAPWLPPNELRDLLISCSQVATLRTRPPGSKEAPPIAKKPKARRQRGIAVPAGL